jgi:aerobic-type carbon monoxide dehydrogenase small subunit (CoxS/CutS family)
MTAPEIRLHLNGKHRTLSREELTQAVHALREQVNVLGQQMGDKQQEINDLTVLVQQRTSEGHLLAVTQKGLERVRAENTRLLDDLRRLLEFGITKGVWTRNELNEALTP